jgi:parvulin-like peptidyl-prolyl isomerase
LPGAPAPTSGVIDQILVKVNGEPILHSDFETLWRERLSVIATQLPQEQIEAQMPMLRMSVMVAMVEETMIEQRAEELGFTADANEVDRSIMLLREQNNLLDDAAWQQALAANGLTEAALRETFERNIVTSRMINTEIQRQTVVSNREVTSYYENNIDQFTEPAQVLFQQLIWQNNPNDPAAAMAKAEAALAELRSGVSLSAVGTKYEALVVQDAASASWMLPDDLRPEILEVLDTLTPLSYSDVVVTPTAIHIMQLMDRKEEQTQPLEVVGNEIRAMLQNQKSEEKFQEYANNLFARATVEIYAEEFNDLAAAWEASQQGGAGGPSR